MPLDPASLAGEPFSCEGEARQAALFPRLSPLPERCASASAAASFFSEGQATPLFFTGLVSRCWPAGASAPSVSIQEQLSVASFQQCAQPASVAVFSLPLAQAHTFAHCSHRSRVCPAFSFCRSMCPCAACSCKWLRRAIISSLPWERGLLDIPAGECALPVCLQELRPDMHHLLRGSVALCWPAQSPR
jgi:hypothetical protein